MRVNGNSHFLPGLRLSHAAHPSLPFSAFDPPLQGNVPAKGIPEQPSLGVWKLESTRASASGGLRCSVPGRVILEALYRPRFS